MKIVTLTLFNKTKVESVPPSREHMVIAKKVEGESMTQCFLKTVASKLVNPAELSAYELRKNDGIMIRVSEELYEKYHAVLNGNSKVSFRSLERLL